METPFQQNIYLYSCSGTQTGNDPFVYEHALGLITSGSMEVYNDNCLVSYPAGTMSLVKRHQLLKVIKQPDGQKPFSSINIFLDQETLKKYSLEHNIHANGIYVGEPNVLLENDDFLKGYFNSLMPYFAQPEKLTTTLAHLKTNEAIELLLRKPALKNFLFDFSEPHRIDLEAYMNRHFSYNIPLEKFAKLTGRSLSTFKRDFAKIYDMTPERWLQKKRLEQAHFLITQQNKRPTDVYLEVGFENLSHFSTAFKKEFGVNASGL